MARRFHATTSIRVGALGVVAAAALVGCGGTPSVRATSTPTPTAPGGNSSAAVPPSAGPDASGSTAAPGPTPSGQSSTSSAEISGSLPAGDVGQTVPGIAHGAIALPPSAVVPDAGRCQAPALRVEPVDLQGSPGGTYADFALHNISRTACAVRGYVGARLVADGGRELATSVRQEPGPQLWVQIANDGSAQFHLRFANPMAGPTPCNPPNAASVRVDVPGVNGTLTSPSPAGGIQACNGELSTAPLGST